MSRPAPSSRADAAIGPHRAQPEDFATEATLRARRSFRLVQNLRVALGDTTSHDWSEVDERVRQECTRANSCVALPFDLVAEAPPLR